MAAAFFAACDAGNLAAIKHVLKENPQIVYAENKRKQNGLLLACLRAREQAVKLILSHIQQTGLELARVVNHADNAGCTPVLAAAYCVGKGAPGSRGKPDLHAESMMHEVLRAQADPAARALNRRNCAHVACTKRNGRKGRWRRAGAVQQTQVHVACTKRNGRNVDPSVASCRGSSTDAGPRGVHEEER